MSDPTALLVLHSTNNNAEIHQQAAASLILRHGDIQYMGARRSLESAALYVCCLPWALLYYFLGQELSMSHQACPQYRALFIQRVKS